MSVPPQVMQQMMAQKQGGAAGAPGQPPGAQPGGMPGQQGVAGGAPQAAPIAQPQEKSGLKAAAMANVQIAMNMLEEALPAFGTESKEGMKLLDILKGLGKLASKRDSSDLVPAEVLQMVRQLPQMGGGTDVQKMLMQQMSQAGKPPMPQGQQMPQGKPPGV